MRKVSLLVIGLFGLPLLSFAGVTVSSPGSGASVQSPVHFVASATTGCSKGVAAMGIYDNNTLVKTSSGSKLDASVSLSTGTHNNTVIQYWDNCGGSEKQRISLNVTGTASPSVSGVTISTPGSGASVQSPVRFVASASSGCSKGVAAMGIYDDNILMMTSPNSSLDTNVALLTGVHKNIVVQSWDHCGGAQKQRISLNVTSGAASSVPSTAKTFYSVEEENGWIGYGELPPVYDICTDCRPKVEWGFKQGITSAPAVDGPVTRFDLGGTVPYSDALFVNHLIGDGTTQDMPDRDGKILDSIHHLVYDVYFYSDHIESAHALEFDIGYNVNGRAYMFGTECRTEAKKVWAVWDNPGHKWVDTAIPCEALDGKWNHLVLKFTRTSDNYMVYDSITLNGKTSTVNWKYNSEPKNWHGLVVNFQLDGNKTQADYSVFLDKLNITYY